MKLYSTENSIHFIGFNQKDYLDIPWDNCTTIHLYQGNFYSPNSKALISLACTLKILKSLGVKYPKVYIHPFTPIALHFMRGIYGKFIQIAPLSKPIISKTPQCISDVKDIETTVRVFATSEIYEAYNSGTLKYIDYI